MKWRGCATYYQKDTQTLKKIDLNWPEEKIWRQVRAISMSDFEPPYASVNGVKMHLTVDLEQQ